MIDLDGIWTPPIQQQNYRALLQAMSHPGKAYTLSFPQPRNRNALHAVLATLIDGEVSLSDPHSLLKTRDLPLLQANPIDADNADFIVCSGNEEPDFNPKLGTLSSPEQSATIILKICSLDNGGLNIKLTGPGVNGSIQCALEGLNAHWLIQRSDWIRAFPMGADLLIVDNSSVMAIPRTTNVEIF